MLKRLMLIAIAACPFNCLGAEVVLTRGYTDVTTAWGAPGPPPSPGTIYFRLFEGPTEVLVTEATIPNVLPSDSPQLWTFDETNAASFGLNWLAATNLIEQVVGNPGSVLAQARLNSGINPVTIDGQLKPWESLRAFNLGRIEIDLNHWVRTPINGGEKLSWRIIGEGAIAPEPTSVAELGLFVLLGACFHRAKK